MDAIASRARGAISIRNVTKVYDPDGVNVLAVENCSVEIAPGELCVVVVPRAAGRPRCSTQSRDFMTSPPVRSFSTDV
jgi:hypothetical protein